MPLSDCYDQLTRPIVTTNPARVLRLDERKGALKPRTRCRHCAVRDDLTVDTVICRGKVMVTGGIPIVKGPFEE